MKFSDKIYTYKDIEEAKKLIGKKVAYSNCLQVIEQLLDEEFTFVGKLVQVNSEHIPFTVGVDFELNDFQFIREVIEEPEYKPFNWEEAQGTLGRIVHRKRGTYAYGEYGQFRVVTSVNLKAGGEVQIMGLTAEKFLELYEFADGKPCGVEVE